MQRIAGFMAATAFISAWISNTATAMMMIPIATAVIFQASKAGEDKNFNIAIMLSVAYAASIGGVFTLIGTTPNLIFAGIYRKVFSTLFSPYTRSSDVTIWYTGWSNVFYYFCWIIVW